MMEAVELQAAHHISDLIQRPIISRERTPHFGRCIVAFVPDPLDQKIYRFLRGHFLEMKIQREDDSRTPMHSPKQSSDTIFRGFLKPFVPKQELPIQSPALNRERRAEILSVRPVAG